MIWWKYKDPYPCFYQSYLDKIKQEGCGNEILALDLETTGMDPVTDQVLSFGSFILRDEKILIESEVHKFFRANKIIENSHIHEILEMPGQGTFEEFIPEILSIIGNKTILGHFVKMDIAFINHQLKKMKLPKLKNPCIDTLEMALKKDHIANIQYASRDEYNLYHLCNRFGIHVCTTHDASEDAFLTALLYLHLKN